MTPPSRPIRVLDDTPSVSVVIPCFRAKNTLLAVIERIGPVVKKIYAVDDCCPEKTGAYLEDACRDPRVTVLFNVANLGVGGATMAGYTKALADGADIVVKLDADGQMDPALIPALIRPIRRGEADYSKGNRFFALENLEKMPRLRLFGNAVLSFVSKASSGYWDVMDPTNGYTAIHRRALSLLPLRKIDNGYFFESDMLFRLNTIRAVIAEIPMAANYGDEESSLRVSKVIREFPLKYATRFLKRIFYNYFLRDFNVCSIEIVAGVALLAFGVCFGSYHWYQSWMLRASAPTGTIMLAVLPIMIAVQLLLAATTLDVMNVPKNPLQRSFGQDDRQDEAEGEESVPSHRAGND